MVLFIICYANSIAKFMLTLTEFLDVMYIMFRLGNLNLTLPYKVQAQ